MKVFVRSCLRNGQFNCWDGSRANRYGSLPERGLYRPRTQGPYYEEATGRGHSFGTSFRLFFVCFFFSTPGLAFVLNPLRSKRMFHLPVEGATASGGWFFVIARVSGIQIIPFPARCEWISAHKVRRASSLTTLFKGCFANRQHQSAKQCGPRP